MKSIIRTVLALSIALPVQFAVAKNNEEVAPNAAAVAQFRNYLEQKDVSGEETAQAILQTESDQLHPTMLALRAIVKEKSAGLTGEQALRLAKLDDELGKVASKMNTNRRLRKYITFAAVYVGTVVGMYRLSGKSGAAGEAQGEKLIAGALGVIIVGPAVGALSSYGINKFKGSTRIDLENIDILE